MTTSTRIQSLRSQGHTMTEIARRIGISRQAVAYHLPTGKRTGRPPVSAHVRDEAARMAREGLPYRLIAQQLGVGVGTAYKYAKEAAASDPRSAGDSNENS